jgi:hypothetical protein
MATKTLAVGGEATARLVEAAAMEGADGGGSDNAPEPLTLSARSRTLNGPNEAGTPIGPDPHGR